MRSVLGRASRRLWEAGTLPGGLPLGAAPVLFSLQLEPSCQPTFHLDSYRAPADKPQPSPAAPLPSRRSDAGHPATKMFTHLNVICIPKAVFPDSDGIYEIKSRRLQQPKQMWPATPLHVYKTLLLLKNK